MLTTVAMIVRLVIFILMEIFCLNRLIWFYDWSLAEKWIQIILVVLYFGALGAVPLLGRKHHAATAGNRKIIAMIEGIISALILYFMLTSVNFSDVIAWLTLSLQVFISAISMFTYCRSVRIERQSKR